ncbi:hypothetical protein ZOSMA_83G00370 [Zostera marina]|uniref:Uncharacterized protein n=1 Tax=Zostera marina TaxID=29655 RepID=A0A0K9NLP6_ZOSMR|nr:hypothetical protein ZOSMA_83G00370 [Zostera marina]
MWIHNHQHIWGTQLRIHQVKLEDPITIAEGSDMELAGSNMKIVGSGNENFGSIIGSGENPTKDPLKDPDNDLGGSRVDNSNFLGDVEKRQGHLSKVQGEQSKNQGRGVEQPKVLGDQGRSKSGGSIDGDEELREGEGESPGQWVGSNVENRSALSGANKEPRKAGEENMGVRLDPPRPFKRYSKNSKKGGGFSYQDRSDQKNSGSRVGANLRASSGSGANSGANSGSSGSSRVSSGSSLSSGGNIGSSTSSGASSNLGIGSGSGSGTSSALENSSRASSGLKSKVSPENSPWGNRIV